MTTKVIVIDGYIGPYGYSKQFIRNELSGQSKNAVTVKISSLGGSVDDALNIYDQFIEHGNVTAELSAFVASSATLVSLGAQTVRMNENSFYLIHKAMNVVDEWGSMNEDQITELISKLEASKQQLAKVTLQLAKMYSNKCKKPVNQILDLMKQNTWLTAQEAMSWGFVDEVYSPEESINYLDNLQMVAMITGNDFPALPRKKDNPSAPNQKPVIESVNEDSIFEKIWNRLIAKGISHTPKNKVEMKKVFLNINSVLNIESMESTDEGVFLNEQQLESIENRILEIQQTVSERDSAINQRDTAITDRDNALSDRTTAITERDAAITSLNDSLNVFNAIDPIIKTAETPEDKAQAIRTLLSKVPGTQAVGIQSGSDKVLAVADWDTINNLPHNKQVDQNS